MLTLDDKIIKGLIKKFSIENEIAAQICGKLKLSKKSWNIVYTDFLTLNEQQFLKDLAFQMNMYVCFLFEDGFERNMAMISPYESDGDFPCRVLSITGNFKFEKVGHRDYLGSILALGIKREKLGDIIVHENGAEILAHSDVATYIMFNLTKIKHTGIKVREEVLENLKCQSINLKELSVNVTSLRLDAVLSGIYNISRTKSSALIKGSYVKINSIVTIGLSAIVKENDILTLRGYGKVKVGKILATTKKERLILSIYKYI